MTELRKVQLQDPNDASRLAEFDNLFKVPIVVDVAHHEIHEGDSFHVDAEDTSLANAATIIIAFKTMAGTKRAHMTGAFSTLVGAHVELTEGPTWDNQSGTLLPIYNRKREGSMGSSGLLEDQAQAGFVASDNMILNPTTVAGGTIISTLFAFGSKHSGGSQARGVDEWILKPETQYAIILTADGAANAAQLIIDWYEHTDE